MSDLNGVKLIPCPICGYDGEHPYFIDGEKHVIQCYNHRKTDDGIKNNFQLLCDADVEGDTLEEAIELWNKGLAE